MTVGDEAKPAVGGATVSLRQRGEAAISGGTRALPDRTSVPMTEATSPVESAGLGPGLRVGSYELIRELGRGGMGVVFLARDVKLGRRVAVKFVLNSDKAFLQRFVVEARTTARCQHENIVVIHEVNDYKELPFMVLEYLEGKSLDQVLGNAPVPGQRAAQLVLPVARALAHAHGHGIVHRDLKLDNVFLTDAGTIKVLDFGIARALKGSDPASESSRARRASLGVPGHITQAGLIVGTPHYMAPEQLLGGDVDHRADIWAFGVLLHLLLTARHPLGPDVDFNAICHMAQETQPLPPSAETMPGVDPRLAAVVDRCLQKDPEERYASAEELAADLEPLAHVGVPIRNTEQCPYPGLVAFAEDDADRYFGRDADVARMLTRLSEQPLLAVVGPSGAGKSSFVRAGVVPSLKRRGERWEVHTIRPGTQPLSALAALAGRLDTATQPMSVAEPSSDSFDVSRMREEPGMLGEILRSRAAISQKKQLLFFDQFEELYTLTSDPEERAAVVKSLMGAADDRASAVRVVLSMRSDFIDRAAEDPEFVAQLTRGLVFLGPIQRSGLRQALESPAQLCGFHFESPDLVERMLDDLGGTTSPLPLLQFAAAQLWEERNQRDRILTDKSYHAMGGIGGALASHGDRVLGEMTPEERTRVRAIFARLVTVEQTRAVAAVEDLVALHPDADGQRDLLDRLASARLVVIHAESEDATVEIIHEALIDSWPTLRSWLDADRDDAAFLHQLHTTAALWDAKERNPGLLWRGDALAEARLWRKRAPDHALSPVENAFLVAALADAARVQRRRKLVWATAFILLAAVAAGAVVALLQIRSAEQNALSEAQRARDEAARASAALDQATRAEREASQATSAAREASAHATRESERARVASAEVATSRENLHEANLRLAEAAEVARAERDRAREAQSAAEKEAQRARTAEIELKKKQEELTRVLAELRKRLDVLEKRSSEISSDL